VTRAEPCALGMAAESAEIAPVAVRQQSSWDCGLACIATVAASLEHHSAGGETHGCLPNDKARSILAELARIVGTTSTWTVDLAYVLHKLKVPFALRSSHLGVDRGLGDMSFYEGFVDTDEGRVGERLSALRKEHDKCWYCHGSTGRCCVVEEAVTLEWLRERVATDGMWAIVLVDSRRLHKPFMSSVCDAVSSLLLSEAASRRQEEEEGGWFARLDDGGFVGHYIVIVGWTEEEDRVHFLDPAGGRGSVSAAQFDAARSARGTDHDALLVPMLRALEEWK
jgi:hypothetical protein